MPPGPAASAPAATEVASRELVLDRNWEAEERHPMPPSVAAATSAA
jgi:hypothetical protein